MIFVTIGTQEPFDRLIRTMDEIAGLHPEIPVIAQVSNSAYPVKHMKTLEFVTPVEFNKLFTEARLVVSHAGMGTIISALQMGKPIAVLPRIASLGEHRNEHQMATAKKWHELKYIRVAFSESELKDMVLSLLQETEIKPLYKLGEFASVQLTTSLKQFINSGK